MPVLLVDRCHQVCQGHALEVTAAFEDAGGGFPRPVAVAGHGNQPRDGLAVGRDGEALAPRGAVAPSGPAAR